MIWLQSIAAASPVGKFLWKDLKLFLRVFKNWCKDCFCVIPRVPNWWNRYETVQNQWKGAEIFLCSSTRKNGTWELIMFKMWLEENMVDRCLFYWTSLLLAFKVDSQVLCLLSVWSQINHLWPVQIANWKTSSVVDNKCGFVFCSFKCTYRK